MYSKEFVEVVKSYLDSHSIDYSLTSGKFSFYLFLRGRIKLANCTVLIEENECLMSAIIEFVTIDKTMLTDVLEYLNMVNNIVLKNQILVQNDHVVCKTYFNLRGMLPNEKAFGRAVSDSIRCIEAFGGGILDVLEKKGTPKEIFEKYLEEVDNEK